MAEIAVAAFTWVVKAGTSALMAAGVSKATAAAISSFAVKTIAITAASTALTALTQPKVNAYEGGAPSEFRSDPNGPIPFLFGRRGIGGIGVDDKAFGADNRFRGIVGVLSGAGPIDALETVYASRAAVTFGGANGAASAPAEFAGKMYFQFTPGHQPQSAALSQPGLHGGAVMTGWGPHRRMSGKAHWMLTLEQDAKFENFPVMPEWLFVARGVLGWDPRLDSTYPGGSGPCRLNDRSTHVYIDDPGIGALNWALGLYENGKLVGGIGRPVEEIAVETLVELANVCDANGWKLSAWPTTRDNPHEVYKAMLLAGGARYAEIGGKLGCIPRKPRVSVATITAADVDGPLEIDTSPPAQDLLNTVYPSCPLEDHFWTSVPLDPVSEPSFVDEDGEVLDGPLDLDYSPSAKQTSEIAAYVMVDSRETIRGRIPVKPYLREVEPGNVVTIAEEGFLLDGVEFLVLDRDTDADTGRVWLWLESESAGKHPYALGQDPTPPTPPQFSGGNPWIAPAPTGGEWTIEPVQLTGPNGEAQPALRISGGTDRTNIRRLHVWYQAAPVTTEGWQYWAPLLPQEFGAGIEITGLAPSTEYFIRLGYENEYGVISPQNYYISGPWMTGALVASDAKALNGVDATEVLADINQLFWDVENLAVEFADGLVEIEQTRLAVDTQVGRLMLLDFSPGDPNPALYAATAVPTTRPADPLTSGSLTGGSITWDAASGQWRLDAASASLTFGPRETIAFAPGQVWEIEIEFDIEAASSGVSVDLRVRRFNSAGANIAVGTAVNWGAQTTVTGRVLKARIGNNADGSLNGVTLDGTVNDASMATARFGIRAGSSALGEVWFRRLRVAEVTQDALARRAAANASISETNAVGAKTDAEGFASAAAGSASSASASAGTAIAGADTAVLAAANAADSSARAERATLLRASGGAIGGDVFGRAPDMLSGSITGDPDTRPDLQINSAQWQLLDPLSAYPGGIFSLQGKGSNTTVATKAMIFAGLGDKIEVEVDARSRATANPGTLLTIVIRRLDGLGNDLGAAVLGTLPANVNGLQKFRATYTVTNAADRAFRVYAVHPAGAVARVDLYRLAAEVMGPRMLALDTALIGPDGQVSSYMRAVNAGSSWVGHEMFARDSGGNLTADHRFAGQIFRYGTSFNSPRMVMDMVAGTRYCWNAAGTIKTLEEDWDTGTITLRRGTGPRAGKPTFISDQGVQFDTLQGSTGNVNVAFNSTSTIWRVLSRLELTPPGIAWYTSIDTRAVFRDASTDIEVVGFNVDYRIVLVEKNDYTATHGQNINIPEADEGVNWLDVYRYTSIYTYSPSSGRPPPGRDIAFHRNQTRARPFGAPFGSNTAVLLLARHNASGLTLRYGTHSGAATSLIITPIAQQSFNL